MTTIPGPVGHGALLIGLGVSVSHGDNDMRAEQLFKSPSCYSPTCIMVAIRATQSEL